MTAVLVCFPRVQTLQMSLLYITFHVCVPIRTVFLLTLTYQWCWSLNSNDCPERTGL